MTDWAAQATEPRPRLGGERWPVSDRTPTDCETLVRRYREVRARSLALARPLSAEDQAAQSMPDASPTKWHLAHTTWFFETMVLTETDGYSPFDPAYNYLFNSYYEALGPRQPRMHRGLLTRPSVEEVRAYRAHVDGAMVSVLTAGALAETLVARVVLGLAHEEQHQELLLTDVLHLLYQNPLRPAYDPGWQAGGHCPEAMSFVAVDAGLIEIGTAAGDGLSDPFAFDNEGPRHSTYCRDFELADRLVTNGEWLSFVDDGGYRRPELWLSDGWAVVQAKAWSAPLYWERKDVSWRRFGPEGPISLDLDAPVAHVSFYEADAFARWCGRRLPTEAEWERAATVSPDRFVGLFGEAWQWTASPYTAYPGFSPSPGALGEYNGKFMINQMGLRGSSWATSPGHSRATYRNFFPPSTRWQITGVRLARDGADDLSNSERISRS